MKDNILVKIIVVIIGGLILGTCEFDTNKKSNDVKQEVLKVDSIEKK